LNVELDEHLAEVRTEKCGEALPEGAKPAAEPAHREQPEDAHDR